MEPWEGYFTAIQGLVQPYGPIIINFSFMPVAQEKDLIKVTKISRTSFLFHRPKFGVR